MKVVVGGSRDQRAAAVRASLVTAAPAPPVREIHTAAHWPFLRYVVPPIARPVLGGGATLWLRDLHLAFPPPNTPGIRLVLTQSTYQLQRVLDAVDANPAYVIVADAGERIRSEMSGRRGPWARIEISDLGPGLREEPGHETAELFKDIPSSAAALQLHEATRQLDAQDISGALSSIEAAVRIDPMWEASHFELGKLWLRADDTARAASAFAEAARLMPTFAAAHGNLGAALGELDRPEAALAALEQALRHDPNGFPILNNIGAVHREAGRLDQAEAAFRRVIAIAPEFPFGHYNLGHTLFLAGRLAEARTAYEVGFAGDPQRNPRQASRLAVARAAAGDATNAIELFEEIRGTVTEETMRDLAQEMEATLIAVGAAMESRGVATLLAAVRGYL